MLEPSRLSRKIGLLYIISTDGVYVQDHRPTFICFQSQNVSSKIKQPQKFVVSMQFFQEVYLTIPTPLEVHIHEKFLSLLPTNCYYLRSLTAIACVKFAFLDLNHFDDRYC